MRATKLAIVPLGCAKNLVNAEQMLWLARDAGYETVADPAAADIVVVNSCGFIQSAKQESIDEILELAQLKAEGVIKRIVVAGCLAERYKDDIGKEIPEIDALVGCGSFDEIIDAVRAAERGESCSLFGALGAAPSETPRVIATPEHTAYLKIAEGCDNKCAYCAIPSIRGPFRSRPFEKIVAEAEALIADGVKELIVIAQDTTRYGLDLYGRRRLTELLDALCGIEGSFWIRMNYLYPGDVDDELIGLVASREKLLNYWDIPMQHCSGKLLASMGRRGGTERELIAKIRKKMPDAVIRSSFIVGYPGETKEDFEELCEFLRQTGIERAGFFAYSQEEGTVAAGLEPQLEETEKERRLQIAERVQSENIDAYNERMSGKILMLLCEGYDRFAGAYFGRSPGEAPDTDGLVFFTSRNKIEPGEFTRVRITGTLGGDLFGKARGGD